MYPASTAPTSHSTATTTATGNCKNRSYVRPSRPFNMRPPPTEFALLVAWHRCGRESRDLGCSWHPSAHCLGPMRLGPQRSDVPAETYYVEVSAAFDGEGLWGVGPGQKTKGPVGEWTRVDRADRIGDRPLLDRYFTLYGALPSGASAERHISARASRCWTGAMRTSENSSQAKFADFLTGEFHAEGP